jgi:PHP family Zn ribbon phosphoesterase
LKLKENKKLRMHGALPKGRTMQRIKGTCERLNGVVSQGECLCGECGRRVEEGRKERVTENRSVTATEQPLFPIYVHTLLHLEQLRASPSQ